MVDIQKANGVQLISGADSNKKGYEIVDTISTTIRNKLTGLVKDANFFSILSDGSQARKTNSEKELVMARIVRNGQPQFLTLGLENMDEYGDAAADNLKKCQDNIFENSEKISLPPEHYRERLVAATADGASVNMSKYNGVLTQMKTERPWLVTNHCVSHRLELAMKTALQSVFSDVKDFMVSIFYYCKRSGKFVRHLKTTAEALGMQYYKFPKVHGTRFLNHQRNGVNILLNNWPVLLQGIENSFASTKKKMQSCSATLRK